MSVLEVSNLRVDLSTPSGALHAVRDASFSIERRETLCVVGESGCGKSMTALALMRLLPGNARISGQVRFEGTDIGGLGEAGMNDLRGNRMAMIFQEPMTSLNPSFTIGDQLVEGFLIHGKGDMRDARARAIDLLERVGISAAEERMRQYPHQLSGGLRQRVMIAMALMCGPDLVIADEPTTALDVTIQAQILGTLAGIRDEFGLSLLVITHDLGVVARVADRVVVMYAGEIVEQGTVEDIFERPQHPYTIGLQGCVPTPGHHGSRLAAIPGRVPSLVGSHRGCSFRNRCAHAQPACAGTAIAMREANGGHDYRCILAPGEARA